MYRGSTPKYTIYLSGIYLADLANLQITFKQKGQIMAERSLTDMAIDPDANSASFSLTQEETMKFKVGMIDKQIRVMDSEGQVTLTRIFREHVDPNIREDLING